MYIFSNVYRAILKKKKLYRQVRHRIRRWDDVNGRHRKNEAVSRQDSNGERWERINP